MKYIGFHLAIYFTGFFNCWVVGPACADSKSVLTGSDPLSAAEVLDRYAATQDKLKSFIITEEFILIEARSTVQPQAPYLKGDGAPTTVIEMCSDGHRTKWYNRMWGHVGLVAEKTPIEEARTNLHLWDGKTSFQFDSTVKPGHRGILWVHPGKKQFDEVGGALRGYLYGSTMEGRIDKILCETGKPMMAPKPTLIHGSSCWLLHAQGKKGRYQVWFDADHDWQVARAYVRKEPGDLWNGRIMSSDILMYYAIEDIRFERIDGIWVPMEAVERMIQQIGKGRKYESKHCIRRTKVLLNPDHDALGSFEPTEVDDGAKIPFYLNTSGFHHLVDPEFVWWRNSPFHVDTRGRLPKSPNAAIPYPIIKKVRNLDVLVEKGKWDRSSTKPVLLCFWNVARTDSQSFVRELTSKSDEFVKRDIKVLLVETNPTNREKAAEWIRSNQIPFLSGGFPSYDGQHPVSERLVEWRIDRLPWLVLSNKDQIIVAEGFTPEQLKDHFKLLSVSVTEHP
ncbi:MAG: hypothetical protein JXA82_06420 [Sedimentisphaerales bacterium]|nr:hypothetical protein [Sedimentisphaerales bacterium]